MRSSDSILLLFLSRKEVKHIPFMLWMSSNCLFQLAVVSSSVSVPGMWQVSAAALWELGLETQIHTGRWKEATVRMVCSSFVLSSLNARCYNWRSFGSKRSECQFFNWRSFGSKRSECQFFPVFVLAEPSWRLLLPWSIPSQKRYSMSCCCHRSVAVEGFSKWVCPWHVSSNFQQDHVNCHEFLALEGIGLGWWSSVGSSPTTGSDEVF